MVKAIRRPKAVVHSPYFRSKSAAAPDEELASAHFAAPFGTLRITASDSGIRSIGISHQHFDSITIVDRQASSSRAHKHVQEAITQLSEYFARNRTAFTLPLDARGTEFQRLAWSALCRIPYGSTISYSQVREIHDVAGTSLQVLQQAKWMDKPTAVRAVGGANGRNPVFLVRFQ
jgi:methylated-DNA-[protein]-cysteine S-methyltransferase